eukprot:3620257-Amphidinium_carterae.1
MQQETDQEARILDISQGFLNAGLPKGVRILLQISPVLCQLPGLDTSSMCLATKPVYGLRASPSLRGDVRNKTLSTMPFPGYRIEPSPVHPSLWLVLDETTPTKIVPSD